MYASDFYQGDHYRAADLGGRDMRARIADVGSVTLRAEPKPKPVLFLEGEDRSWILNKTRHHSLTKALGNNMLTWRGAEIRRAPKFASYRVPGRARSRAASGPPRDSFPRQTANQLCPDDDLPF